MAWADLKTQAAATGGTSGSNFDGSGFVVNYGGGVLASSGGPLPAWAWLAAAAAGAWWLLKRK